MYLIRLCLDKASSGPSIFTSRFAILCPAPRWRIHWKRFNNKTIWKKNGVTNHSKRGRGGGDEIWKVRTGCGYIKRAVWCGIDCYLTLIELLCLLTTACWLFVCHYTCLWNYIRAFICSPSYFYATVTVYSQQAAEKPKSEIQIYILQMVRY